jgi:hypothetical protein
MVKTFRCLNTLKTKSHFRKVLLGDRAPNLRLSKYKQKSVLLLLELFPVKSALTKSIPYHLLHPKLSTTIHITNMVDTVS